tara:strand:+ start:236 stop:1228 length:993 start_codon:yes stop_codon:yes gene_type:complete
MILKSFELNKINLKKNKLILFYGKNEGLKKESILKLTRHLSNIQTYEEKEILQNLDIFLENILSKSLFDNEKIIIIKRVSDKILKVLENISDKNLDNLNLIINAENLEKRSKLRIFFEKNKRDVCIPVYPDSEETLLKLANTFLKKSNIQMSPVNINFIINRSNGERETLLNELDKIKYFCKNGKKITHLELIKLVNLTENHNIIKLVDNCLIMNQNKIINILNENNFSNEDGILITRTFLNKLKNLLKLSKEYEVNKNIDLTISSAKPPIFWKDKEITKQQLNKWSYSGIKKLIYNLNDLELDLKKNLTNSIIFTTNFIISRFATKTNN